jgi:hypothetical protein
MNWLTPCCVVSVFCPYPYEALPSPVFRIDFPAESDGKPST